MWATVADRGVGRYNQPMVMAQQCDGAIAVSLANPADTQTFAARLAPFARPGDVIALAGDLGTGKTTFARGFINALLEVHGLPAEDVPSPTFTLVQEYQLPNFTLFHIDLYRIETQSELFELGLEEAFAGGVSLVEWPDRLGLLLPANRLELTFSQAGAGENGEDDDRRRAVVIPFGDWKGRLEAGALNG